MLLPWIVPIGSPSDRWTPQALAEAVAERPERAEFVPGEVLVKLREGFGLGPDYPLTSKGSIEGLGVLWLGVPAGRELEIVQRLQDDPRVEWAEPNYLRDVMRVPNDQLYQQFQWNLRKMQTDQAWDITTGSSEVMVAVLDTGVDSSHPDLAGKLVAGYDFLNDDPDPADDSGHGTHNAGVIGAASNNGTGVAGVSWGTRIMPIKVLNSSGVGPDAVIARGITYAVDQGAQIVNMSFGSSTSSQLLAQAVRYAHDKGALLVAAAGNTAKLDNAVIYPAAYEQVLAVAATDEEDKVGDFSQHHPYVGISAPGVRIVSTFWRGSGYGGYVSASGTSAAAPHVSGVAALIRSVNPDLTSGQIQRILQETADDLGASGKDPYYGTGRVNAYKAVLAAKPAAVPPTPATPARAPSTPAPVATPATVPKTVWYFAEGSTLAPFDLWLLLQNPNASGISAKVTYMKRDGSQQSQEVWLPPASRKSIFVNQLVPETEVSMKVESDSLLFAERALFFRTDGHASVGVAAPSTRWYMAEGSTRRDFDTRILLQNPSDTQANVNVSFLTSGGQKGEVLLAMPPNSWRSLNVNQVVPDAEVSTVVSSDQPILAERAMYFGQGGGHGGPGSSQLSRNWYLAEGRVGEGYDSWLLAMNPNQAVANLKVTYMGEEGSTTVGYYAVRPGSRLSIPMNDAVLPGRYGARVESDQPIVVERSTYFAGGRGGHNVVATPLLSQEWYLTEGATWHPFTEEIAVLNPSDHGANLVVTFMKVDGGVDSRHFVVNPTSRLTLKVNELLPDAELSAKVASDTPIAVERSMYFSGGLGGTSSFGVPR